MNTTEMTTVAKLDCALDVLIRRREVLLRHDPSVRQAAGMADLYRLEAQLWASVYETAADRLVWRAGLAAEVHARQCAALWWRRAMGERTCDGSACVGGAR
jgi:predicted DNA-binding ribbon-helix-helix protein